jgi:hypothetical protein
MNHNLSSFFPLSGQKIAKRPMMWMQISAFWVQNQQKLKLNEKFILLNTSFTTSLF